MEDITRDNIPTPEDVYQAVEIIKNAEERAALLRENREHKKGRARRDDVRYGLEIIELNLRIAYETLRSVPPMLRQPNGSTTTESA